MTKKVGRPGRIDWDEEKIQYLRDYYPQGDYDTLFEKLNFNDIDSIRHKVSELGIKSNLNKYSEDDLIFIRENFETMKYRDIAKALNKTVSGIQTKVNDMNLRKNSLKRCPRGQLKKKTLTIQ